MNKEELNERIDGFIEEIDKYLKYSENWQNALKMRILGKG